MTDTEIIDLFFVRSEKAISALSKKYGKISMNLAFNILGNKQDSEECVNDSYLGVWNKVPPENPNPLLTFLLKIVRNLSLKRVRYNTRQKRNNNFNECIDELHLQIESKQNVEEEFDYSQISLHINEFLSTLDETNQMLFVRRYWYMDSYEQLSKFSGLKEGAIRTRLSRIRESLKEFLIKKGVYV